MKLSPLNVLLVFAIAVTLTLAGQKAWMLAGNQANQNSYVNEGVVRTHRIELLDRSGRVRLVLGTANDETVGLFMPDTQAPSASLRITADGQPTLSLLDSMHGTSMNLKPANMQLSQDTSLTIDLKVGQDRAGLAISDKPSGGTAKLGVEEGIGRMSVASTFGEVTSASSAQLNGTAVLSRDKSQRASIEISPSAGPSASFSDSRGRKRTFSTDTESR